MVPLAPVADCPLCPRLAAFREGNRRAHPDWWNDPVPAWGALDSRLLIVGLAPGLKGANRTGRPFTGDHAGDLLYATLEDYGFAEGSYERRADDDLALIDARVSNAVRCVPPENRPRPSEIQACRIFLEAEIAAMPRLRMILALGRIAHDAVLGTFEVPRARHAFRHGAFHALPGGRVLADSYHCSRYNTQTGVLTAASFATVFAAIRQHLPRDESASRAARIDRS